MHTHRPHTLSAARLAPALLASVGLLAACATDAPRQTKPSAAVAVAPAAGPLTDQDIADAYVYLLGRLLVLRQQKIDFEREGMRWNSVVHKPVGGVDWPNPNLDVVYSEAWVAVDEKTCVALEMPRFDKGRYYTWHMLNGWGETTLNINERTFPQRPDGLYALCLKGAQPAALPAGALRVDLPSRTSRVLARVELGSDAKEAIRLQKLMKLTPLGQPAIAPLPPVPEFSVVNLPGAEALADASAVLDSEADINPGMAAVQAKTRAAEALVRSGAEGRAHVDKVIRELAIPEFRKLRATMGQARNGWFRPTGGSYGENFGVRAVANLVGIWANIADEYTGFVARGMDGGVTYTQTYARNALPEAQAQYFWSVTAVDAQQFRVIPNAQHRYLLNNQSGLRYNADGSLTLVYAPVKPAGTPDANWLPTPKDGKFNLTFRMYGPRESVRSGGFFPPPLVQAP